MKNISKRNMHLKRFLLITLLIFTAVFLTHLYVLANGIVISIAESRLPVLTSVLAIFVSGSMVVMSLYYYRSIKQEKA